MRSRRLGGVTGEVVEFCAGFSGPTRVAYAAGPRGFGRAREDLRGDLMRARICAAI